MHFQIVSKMSVINLVTSLVNNILANFFGQQAEQSVDIPRNSPCVQVSEGWNMCIAVLILVGPSVAQ